MQRIIRPSQITWPDDYSLRTIGISQSMWNIWFTCERKFILFLNGYKTDIALANVNFGNQFHDIVEEVYRGGELPSDSKVQSLVDKHVEKELDANPPNLAQMLETDAALGEATIIEYFKHYGDDFKKYDFEALEEYFEVMFMGVKMRGKKDGRVRLRRGDRSRYNMEHKTKGQIPSRLLEYLSLDFQNHYYLLGDELEGGEKKTGTLYNVVRKSQMKPSKTESLSSFKKRVQETIQKNPSHFFKRWPVTYTTRDRNVFKQDLITSIEDMKSKQGKIPVANRSACLKPFVCPYLEACAKDNCNSLPKNNEPIKQRLFPELKEDLDNDNKKNTKNENKIKTAKRRKK